MPLDLKSPETVSRFGWVIQGRLHGVDRTFDDDLGQFPEAAVVPTLGAFIPEWLLIVPRAACLSMAELSLSQRKRVLVVADSVSASMSVCTGEAVMFEHGAGYSYSASGCGVDQAHIHVVGGQHNILERLMQKVDEVVWLPVDHRDPWSNVAPGSDYLLVRDAGRAFLAHVERPVSQRLRRALADVTGKSYEWDYRKHPNLLNVNRTKELFRGVFINSASGGRYSWNFELSEARSGEPSPHR